MKEQRATSFTGVPYSFEILNLMRFFRMDLPDLTLLTQGGGKMSRQLNLKFAEYCRDNGKRWIATYGQSEGTARMAYLPAEWAIEKVGSIGRAVPNAELSLIDSEGNRIEGANTEGEMCYRGKNVTMGYARSREDLSLAAIFGGCIGGVGMGLVLLAKSTTGGTEMVATLIQHYYKHYSVVQIIQFLDGAVVIAGLFVFGVHVALYAIVAIFVTSKVSDALMEGLKFSKAAFIITDHYDQVAKRIMTELERGVTGLHAKGMYSGAEKCMLYCVVSRKEIVQVKEIVSEVDPDAFVIVSDAREVLGEGFQEQMS